MLEKFAIWFVVSTVLVASGLYTIKYLDNLSGEVVIYEQNIFPFEIYAPDNWSARSDHDTIKFSPPGSDTTIDISIIFKPSTYESEAEFLKSSQRNRLNENSNYVANTQVLNNGVTAVIERGNIVTYFYESADFYYAGGNYQISQAKRGGEPDLTAEFYALLDSLRFPGK